MDFLFTGIVLTLFPVTHPLSMQESKNAFVFLVHYWFIGDGDRRE